LIKTTQKDIATIKDEKLLACLQQRLQLLEKTYVQASEDKGPQLSGFFSYDFRLNKTTAEEAKVRKIMAKFI